MTSPIQNYAQAEAHYETLRQKEAKKANVLAALRLITMLSLLGGSYHYFNAQNWVALATVIGILGGTFLVLVFVHAHIKKQETLFALLVKTNQNEQAYLRGDLSAFDGGDAFINPEHPYTFDLDMFGNLSIFQHLNRTATPFGRTELAQNLGHPDTSDIILRQEAIRELAEKLEWRQLFQAKGLLFADKDERMGKFKYWIEKPAPLQNQPFFRIISYVLPVLTLIALGLNIMTDWDMANTLFKTLGILNLLIVGSQQKHIKQEHELLTNMSLSFQKYAGLLKAIENESFKSPLLNQLKQSIVVENASASQALKRLSVILNQFDSIFNPFAAILSNGLFQYHIHALFSLAKWKATFGQNVFQWFPVMGAFESLSSLANFSYNHPEFIFPTLSPPAPKGSFERRSSGGQHDSPLGRGHNDSPLGLGGKNVGHPLIPSDKRIGNDITFKDPSFVVLTGSNMSGKSTFLRTLGVNLVLAKMGAPVCADQFSFYPFNVFVSMRVSDSLQNSESFFFAELKRLQRIIAELAENQKTFIILDEILRGTNSNDKRAGTIGLIQNLMKHKAVGIIATHDLVIGDMKKQYPDYLENKCFEVEIVDNDLHFDYKLADGVAQNMSAAFLMTKMGIIE